MHQATKKLYFKLSELDEFLRGFIFFATLSIFLFCGYLLVDNSKSIRKNIALVEVEITLERMLPGNQRGFAFLGRPILNGPLIKLNVVPLYTQTTESLKSKIGKRVKVIHYDNHVLSCFINEVQVCFPKCASNYDCESMLQATNVKALKWFTYAALFLSLLCLFVYLIRVRCKP